MKTMTSITLVLSLIAFLFCTSTGIYLAIIGSLWSILNLLLGLLNGYCFIINLQNIKE